MTECNDIQGSHKSEVGIEKINDRTLGILVKVFKDFLELLSFLYLFLDQVLNFSPGSISLESQLDEFEEMQSQVISIAYDCLLEYYLWKCNLDLQLDKTRI